MGPPGVLPAARPSRSLSLRRPESRPNLPIASRGVWLVSTKSSEFERRIVAYVEAHTPIERDESLRHRGTAEALVMRGCGYAGGLVHFRTHLKRARRKGLIHGDLIGLIALGPAPPTQPVFRLEPHVVEPGDLQAPARRAEPDPTLVVSAAPAELVDAIVHFDRSPETIRLLAERGLSY